MQDFIDFNTVQMQIYSSDVHSGNSNGLEEYNSEQESMEEPTIATCLLSDDRQTDATCLLINDRPTRGGHVVYACFLILGLGTLLPWNFFITAESYWMFKFRNTTSGDMWQDAERTYLQNIYTPLQVSLSEIINFLFLFINAIGSQFVAQKTRLVGALLIMITFFSITTAMVEINSDEWQLTFFSVTMIIIVIMNASTAIFQGGVYGVAGMFPLTYINALNIGQALGGVFASLARIISIYFGSDPVTSAFIFFFIADIVMVLTLFEYLYVSRTNFYKFYSSGGNLREDAPKETSSFRSLMKDHWRIFKEIWFLGVAVCFVFIVTLSVYPVMCVRIKSTYENKVWTDEYFQPVVTFFLFNICDYASRHLAEYIMWPARGSRTIIILSFLRVIFIPLFLLCNHDANSIIPSVFKSDFWYMAFMIGFGLSNGYLVSLCMMYAPRMVAAHDSEKASTMMAALIGLGLLVGAGLSFLFALIS